MSSEAVRSIVAANTYMTLATADEQGNPWASPVWYATADWREFVWVSAPEARHSQNLARRPVLAIVIFDSRQPPGTGEAVYLRARAEPVPEPEFERCLRIFATESEKQGLADWKRADVEPPARLRLYRAIATEHFILSAGDERISVDLSP
jgi:nitroimidazol reductase NimA-like FMN-containing flavoprotein (pyridoxamine 5'-phosphate oxidase superfamily)